MTTSAFGKFRVANKYLNDPEHLESLFQEDGYLFFRGVLDVAAVLQVKRDLLGLLQEQGVVKTGASEPIWTGASLDQIDDVALYSLTSCDLLSGGSAKLLASQAFGEPAFMFRNPNIR